MRPRNLLLNIILVKEIGWRLFILREIGGILDFLIPDLRVIVIISTIAYIAWVVYTIVWDWKMFEKIGRPGWWWALTILIFTVFLVLIGVATWGEGSKNVSSGKNTGMSLSHHRRRY